MSRIKKCPSSPNCVCTLAEETGRKKMDALTYRAEMSEAKNALKEMVAGIGNTRLIEEGDAYLHFTFKTKLGGFIDDVEFEFNNDKKEITFRSASRVGWSDMGANKRRMKKISKMWAKQSM